MSTVIDLPYPPSANHRLGRGKHGQVFLKKEVRRWRKSADDIVGWKLAYREIEKIKGPLAQSLNHKSAPRSHVQNAHRDEPYIPSNRQTVGRQGPHDRAVWRPQARQNQQPPNTRGGNMSEKGQANVISGAQQRGTRLRNRLRNYRCGDDFLSGFSALRHNSVGASS